MVSLWGASCSAVRAPPARGCPGSAIVCALVHIVTNIQYGKKERKWMQVSIRFILHHVAADEAV